jgi:hypothetical protein
MTNKNSEALRLADALECTSVIYPRTQAAAELRRLHEVNAELLEALKEIIPKNLNLFNNFPDKTVIPTDFTLGEFRKIAAAIVKATGETK